jgi:hypothetical protein
MNTMYRFAWALSCALLLAPALWAQTEGEVPAMQTTVSLQTSTLPEAKISVQQDFTWPMLTGDSPLTSGNNLKVSVNAAITPIDLGLSAKATLTPIAFLQFSAGGSIGSGWNAELFGAPIYGIGINSADGTGQTHLDGSAFDGALWRIQGSGLFQFDLAAVFPGEWHHVVMQTLHEVGYRAYSRAEAGDSWVYQNDGKENRNGPVYYGMYMLGYQMPLFLNTVGIMGEVTHLLYDTPSRSDWGDDLPQWTLSALINFTVIEDLSAALILQFHTVRNYTTGDGKTFYQDRALDGNNPVSMEFFRLAVIVNWILR